jgi:hypothetical protein
MRKKLNPNDCAIDQEGERRMTYNLPSELEVTTGVQAQGLQQLIQQRTGTRQRQQSHTMRRLGDEKHLKI